MAKRFKKILSIIVIFVMTVVNYGFPLKAIASEGASFFGFSFFQKNEIEFKAYFGDNEENLQKDVDVNEMVNLTVEITPLDDEYLKEGTLKFNLANGNLNNFKIKSVKLEEQVVEEDETKVTEKTTEEIKKENIKSEIVDEPEIKNTSVFESVGTKSLDETSALSNEVLENTVATSTLEDVVENSVVQNEVTEDIEIVENIVTNVSSEIVDKEEFDEEEKEFSKEAYIVKLINDNEIGLKNIIDSTKMFIELEYVGSEKINVEDLYGDIEILLEGKYINEDLETVDVVKEQIVTLGWEYSKDIEISSEYVKVSPFTVGEVSGTILENIVTVKRDIDENNFLPIKETNIEIQIPRINDRLPIGISVSSNKLMATLGAGVDKVEFTEDNWTYDEETGILKIKVKNDNLALGNGEDKFDIICRYEEYIEAEEIELERNIKVKVEEYSSNESKVQEKKIEDVQTKEIKPGELMSCTAVESEETINKGKINANFYTEAGYETEFSDIVNVTVLTSDVIEDIILETSKRVYKDADGNELDATGDVKYKGIKFNYNEVKEMLERGSTIDILDEQDTVLHTITKEESECSILFESKVNNIKIRINEVAVNKTLTVELIKTIDKSEYTAEEFSKIEILESSVDVKVKYVGLEETFKIFEMKNIKTFSESYTKANLSINREYLSTTEENENVEFKIELYNNFETSDLYKNPSFELVFPSNVTEVKLNNINTLYQNGMKIKDFEAVNENGISKIKVNLEGTQTEFNPSNMTNGTNILINANIKVDELTIKKYDEVKLYYCNEAVSNYGTEVDWNLEKGIPAGILKRTNGYDSVTFKYQMPIGLLTVNGISNYNNENEKIQSVKQGIRTEEIELNSNSKVSTMELLALNNTGNECLDVMFIGRIPFKGNKDVITNQDIGTTTDALMKGFIKADVMNVNQVDIYYSENPNANKDINDASNGWFKEEYITDITKVKSFLIVVKDVVKDGTVLKFTYDFEIPANLPYESKIAGSFGAFYNNKTDVAIVYESSVADLVGLVTEVGPKVDATLVANIENGADVGEQRFINYTLVVENTGNILAEEIKITNPIPKYTRLYEYSSNLSVGNDNYIESEKKELSWTIDKLEPGEKRVYNYLVKTEEIPSLESYYGVAEFKEDEKGKYYLRAIEEQIDLLAEPVEESINEEIENKEEFEKIYIDNNFEINIENKASITVNNLSMQKESNSYKNKLVDSNFDIEITKSCGKEVPLGEQIYYEINARNITDNTLENVVLEIAIPENVEYIETLVSLSGRGLTEDENGYIHVEEFKQENISFDEATRTVKVKVDDVKSNEIIRVDVKSIVTTSDIEEKTVVANVYLEDGTKESSTKLGLVFIGPKLEVSQNTNLTEMSVMEDEYVEFLITIKNVGNGAAKDLVIEEELSKNLKNVTAEISGDINSIININDNKINEKISSLEKGCKMVLKISGEAKLDDDEIESYILNKAVITANYVKEIQTEELKVLVNRNPDKKEDIIESDFSEDKKTNIDNTNDELENDYIDPDIQNNNNNNNPNNNNQNGNDNDNNNVNNDSENNSNGSNNQGGTNGDNTSNDGSNTGTDNNGNTPNSNTNQNVNNNEPEEVKKYEVSGQVWLDLDKNGRKESNEEEFSNIKVQLVQSGKKLKTISTDGNGRYTFKDLDAGKYNLIFMYDGSNYTATTYQAKDVEANVNSDAIENVVGTAVTNDFELVNDNVSDLDFGLIKRDEFNLMVEKYITKSIVKTGDKQTVKEYENAKFGKIEVKARDLKKTTVDLEYVFEVKNTGEIAGTISSVVDYMPKDMTFDESKNSGWYLGKDGNIYNDSFKNTMIQPGETKTLTLVLSKQMTEENTGVVSNMVTIKNLENQKKISDNNEDDNTATQEMIISVGTGIEAKTVIIFVLLAALVFVFAVRKKISFKKIYK